MSHPGDENVRIAHLASHQEEPMEPEPLWRERLVRQMRVATGDDTIPYDAKIIKIERLDTTWRCILTDGFGLWTAENLGKRALDYVWGTP